MKNLLILFLLILSLNSQAANQYCDPSFTGVSDGSITNPWTSYSQFNQNALSLGDSMLLKRGQSFDGGQFSFLRSGSSTRYFVLGAYGTGPKPVLKGNGSTLNYLLFANNRSYIVIRDLVIIDSTVAENDIVTPSKIQRAITLAGSTQNVIIDSVEIYRTGVGVYIVGSRNTVKKCRIEYSKMIVNTNNGGFDDYGSNGIIISGSLNTIEDCYIAHCYGDSYDFTYDGGAIEFYGSGSTITGTMIRNNTCWDNNGIIEFGAASGEPINDVTILNNLFINNEAFSTLHVSGSNFYAYITNIKVYNNTVIHTSAGRLGETKMFYAYGGGQPNPGTLDLKNNIFYLTANGMDMIQSGNFNNTQLSHANNLYFFGAGCNANYLLDPTERITTGTIFTSQSGQAQTWNYLLPVGSPAVNIGMPLGFSTDKKGDPYVNNPDAGCYELQAVTPTPPPVPGGQRFIIRQFYSPFIFKPGS